jgi:hypothetical protein
MAQTQTENLVPHLCHIFRAYMVYGLEASQSNTYFKPRELDYTKAKAYFSISLSAFLSKMEKPVDRHIRDSVLKKCLYTETSMLTK